MKITKLRGQKVIVDIPKDEVKEAFKKTESGIFVDNDETKAAQKSEIKLGTVILKGKIKGDGDPMDDISDLEEGMEVLVKKFQGERLVPEKEWYVFRGRDILGIA